jgi:hypothetical protein
MELMDRQEVISDLKEKFRVDGHYILTGKRSYKILNLLKLYIFIYFKCEYTNDMDMGNLYIKYRVAHYRGEDIPSVIKEINDTFLKINNKHVINGKGPPLGSDYYNMYDLYLDNCGVEPPTNVHAIILEHVLPSHTSPNSTIICENICMKSCYPLAAILFYTHFIKSYELYICIFPLQ